jgi:two-component system chemotaxis sensor kinase CheA
MLVLGDGVLQLLEGSDVFRRKPDGEHEFVVIVRTVDRRLALAVDELVGQRELVTRPFPAVASDGEPVSGGAALADGRIALIVDCDALAALARDSDGRGLPVRPTSQTSTVTALGRVAA